MRLLFTSSPGVGHLMPILPVAIAARVRGHDVVVGCGGSLEPLVSRAGLRHAPMGQASLHEVRDQVAGWAAADGRLRSRLMYTEAFGHVIAAAIADDILDFASDWRPEVIVHEDMELGSWIAAERLEIPHATIQATAWRPWLGALQYPHQNELRVAHGLAPQPDLAGQTGARWFTTRPPALRDPAWPMPEPLGELRPDPDDRVGGALGGASDWLDEPIRRPRVAVTLGTMNAHRTDLLHPLVEGIAALDVEVVVALGADPATLGPVPANVRVEAFVPMSRLLRRSSVVVHHGGSGTTLAALAAGIPSAFVPITADQPDNAAAVVAAGAGRILDPADLTVEAVREAVDGLITAAACRDRARAIAAEIAAMRGAESAVAEIEGLIGG